jgi:hypothetical protein
MWAVREAVRERDAGRDGVSAMRAGGGGGWIMGWIPSCLPCMGAEAKAEAQRGVARGLDRIDVALRRVAQRL